MGVCFGWDDSCEPLLGNGLRKEFVIKCIISEDIRRSQKTSERVPQGERERERE